jgi:hypothetical protein
MKIMKNNLLNNKKWAVFSIKELFNVYTGSTISKKDIKMGTIPRISATSNNNGVQLFTEIGDIFKVYNNFISISFLGNIFYHPYKCSLDMKIHGIKPKYIELNYNKAMFLITCIKKNLSLYSYGNQLSSNDLKNLRIQLPVNADKEPDWDFMDNHIRKYFINIKKVKIPSKHIITDFRNLNELKWKDFFITDMSQEVKRGKRLTKKDQVEGSMPYISSKMMNNGIDSMIGNKDDIRMFSNCLTIANSGSVGYTFYHPYTFIASDHVTSIYIEGKNRYHYLFIKTSLERIKDKYSFNREINDARIRREKIMLPVNQNKEIDWDFMEQYMKRQENKIIEKLRDFELNH